MSKIERLEEGVLYDAKELEGFVLLHREYDGEELHRLHEQKVKTQIAVGLDDKFSVANQIKTLHTKKLRPNIDHIDCIWWIEVKEFSPDGFGREIKIAGCQVRV